MNNITTNRNKPLLLPGMMSKLIVQRLTHVWNGGGGGLGGLMLGAYNWLVAKCNAPNVGYSQTYRNGQVVNGIEYYDCSSIIYFALIAGGFDLNPNVNAFTTFTMGGVLTDMGFFTVPLNEQTVFMPGDILVRNNSYGQHTEMVYDENYTMGAHSASYPLEDQVSINTGGNTIKWYTWDTLYRFPSAGSIGDWDIGGNSEYFALERMRHNATIIKTYFTGLGWTLESVCGLLGNMQQESTMNPALIEIGGTGHGLVQWTPPENLYDVLDVLYGNHEDWFDGNKQCYVIYAEYQQSSGIVNWGIEGQWYSTASYPMTWKQWTESTADPGTLALAFQANYERPAAIHPERAGYAREWYSYFTANI